MNEFKQIVSRYAGCEECMRRKSVIIVIGGEDVSVPA
jgi:hypothetical protein